jgi:hypothetical protein
MGCPLPGHARHQVRDAIHTARERVLLTLPTRQGRPGGTLTPAAEKLLHAPARQKRTNTRRQEGKDDDEVTAHEQRAPHLREIQDLPRLSWEKKYWILRTFGRLRPHNPWGPGHPANGTCMGLPLLHGVTVTRPLAPLAKPNEFGAAHSVTGGVTPGAIGAVLGRR